MAWKLAEWRHDWFVATDKRLLLFYGFITRKVSMMPLMKVTDMSYERSVPGRILGYGRFVMESAGQDQALHEVNWVPEPDEHYRAICAEIFGVADHADPSFDEDGHDDRWEDGPAVAAGHGGRRRRHTRSVCRAGTTRGTRRVRPNPPRVARAGSLYRSPDLRGPRPHRGHRPDPDPATTRLERRLALVWLGPGRGRSAGPESGGVADVRVPHQVRRAVAA